MIHISRQVFSLCSDYLQHLPDDGTDRRLLPEHLWRQDNSLTLRHYRSTLKFAITNCLSLKQQQYIRQYYWLGMSKSAIAREHGVSCAAITKAIKAAEQLLLHNIQLYLQIHKILLWDCEDA